MSIWCSFFRFFIPWKRKKELWAKQIDRLSVGAQSIAPFDQADNKSKEKVRSDCLFPLFTYSILKIIVKDIEQVTNQLFNAICGVFSVQSKKYVRNKIWGKNEFILVREEALVSWLYEIILTFYKTYLHLEGNPIQSHGHFLES